MKSKRPIQLLLGSLILPALLVCPAPAEAQTDTIQVHARRLHTATLKTGPRQYLVYMQALKDKKTLRTWLWVRHTRLEERNKERVFVTTQNWYSTDTLGYRTAYSVNRVKDFSPIFHSEATTVKTKAFNWTDMQVLGADSVKQNTMKDFRIDLAAPTFNWNLDIELFEMLPLAKDKVFAIPFYDAGIGKPTYAIYKVAGSETINLYATGQADCWKLVHESDHNGQHFKQVFWISKKDRELLMEEDSYAGGYRYKIKLPAFSRNFQENFKAIR